MRQPPQRPLSDNVIIVLLGAAAAVIVIVMFVTGQPSLPHLFASLSPEAHAPLSSQATSTATLWPPATAVAALATLVPTPTPTTAPSPTATLLPPDSNPTALTPAVSIVDTTTPSSVAGAAAPTAGRPSIAPTPTATFTPNPAPLFDAVMKYRLVEKQLVEALQPNGRPPAQVDQPSDVATGEALAELTTRIAKLAAQNQYQQLQVSDLQLTTVIWIAEGEVGILVYEYYSLATFQLSDSGDYLIAKAVHEGQTLCGLRQEDGKWKVARVVYTDSP